MRDKFLVCSYVEGSGFLVVSELSERLRHRKR